MTPLARQTKAVLFDLDGTLIDSAEDLALAVNRMREKRGLPPLPSAQYRPFVGSGAQGLLPVGFGVGVQDPQFPQMRLEFFDTYEACIGEATRPFPGIAPLLLALQANGIPWGIVTNKVERFASPIVAGEPVLAACATLVAGDTTAQHKPHPLPLLHAAQQLRMQPADCIYVGDDRRDMLAGKAAGMGTVAALYGYIATGENTDEWPADARIKTPGDLAKLLRFA